jgi:hypothetical protein
MKYLLVLLFAVACQAAADSKSVNLTESNPPVPKLAQAFVANVTYKFRRDGVTGEYPGYMWYDNDNNNMRQCLQVQGKLQNKRRQNTLSVSSLSFQSTPKSWS